MIAFVLSLVSPLNANFSRFSAFRSLWLYRLKFTDQVIYLEHFLNAEYSIPYNVETRDADIASGSIIHIQDVDFLESENEYFEDEAQPSSPTYFRIETLVPGANLTESNVYFKSELTLSLHFRVVVPSQTSFDSDRMRAQIDFYKKAGKQYEIITY